MKKASGRLTMSMQPRRELEGKPVTKLMDVQDNTGRGDGENYQIGFLTVTDQPYPELVMAAREVAASMYPARYGAK